MQTTGTRSYIAATVAPGSILLLERSLSSSLLSQEVHAGNSLAHPVRLRRDGHPTNGDDGQEDVFDAEAESNNVTPHAYPELLIYRAVGPVSMCGGGTGVCETGASVAPG